MTMRAVSDNISILQVHVPPRLGWRSGHHDTIKVELVLVRVNNDEWTRLGEEKLEL